MSFKHLPIFYLLLFGAELVAQNTHQFGALPFVNVSKRLDSALRLNFKAETRQNLYIENEFAHRHSLVDISVLLRSEVSLHSSLAGGYLARVEDGLLIHRTIQQWAIVQNKFGLKIAHRFVTDQTFEKEEGVALRLRYRFASLFPLNGERANARELYLKVSNEYLNALQSGEYGLEIRLNATVGYKFSNDSKLEWGVEGRVDSFLGEQGYRNRAWTIFGWYLTL